MGLFNIKKEEKKEPSWSEMYYSLKSKMGFNKTPQQAQQAQQPQQSQQQAYSVPQAAPPPAPPKEEKPKEIKPLITVPLP